MSRTRFVTTALAALLLAAPSLHAVDLTSVGDTKLSVYGFVQAYGTYYVDAVQPSNWAGSLFYFGNPAQTGGQPTGGFVMQVKPTRFGFASTTPSAALGDVTTKIEMDFNNGSGGPGLRHAYIKFGGWTIGKAWSLWNDLDAGPDTVDWAGAIGTPCYDTPRFPLISYMAKLDKNNSLGVSLEQNGGYSDGTSVTGASSASGVSKIPTIVAAYTYADSWGHVAVRGLAQNYEAYIGASGTYGTAGYTSSTTFSKMEAAFMVSGDVKIAKDDLVFNVYSGNALGQYGTGFQAAILDTSAQSVTAYKSIGWMAGYTHTWTDAVRSNVVLSGTSWSSDSSIPTTSSANGTDMKSAMNGFVNTFVKLTKNTELGVEYVYEVAKTFGPLQAYGDDLKRTDKNSASKIEVSLHVGF